MRAGAYPYQHLSFRQQHARARCAINSFPRGPKDSPRPRTDKTISGPHTVLDKKTFLPLFSRTQSSTNARRTMLCSSTRRAGSGSGTPARRSGGSGAHTSGAVEMEESRRECCGDDAWRLHGGRAPPQEGGRTSGGSSGVRDCRRRRGRSAARGSSKAPPRGAGVRRDRGRGDSGTPAPAAAQAAACLTACVASWTAWRYRVPVLCLSGRPIGYRAACCVTMIYRAPPSAP
jgi:hypothetical protein